VGNGNRRSLSGASRSSLVPQATLPDFVTFAAHFFETLMLFMVIETFRGGDPIPVYRRFRDRGRLMPEGVVYWGSWVTEDWHRCFQIMESPNRLLLDQWISQWDDITDFEVISVMTSADAAAAIAPRL
jgi:Protein of unknown function (DUF3303)